MIQHRCSRLPLTIACAASAVEPSVRIETDSDPARLGDASHEYLWGHVGGKDLDVPALAKRYRVSMDDLHYLCWAGRQCWDRLRGYADNWEPELYLAHEKDGLRLTGHLDAVGTAGSEQAILLDDEGIVIDWKSGRLDEDYSNQLRGYAWLLCQELPQLDRVRTCLVRLRDLTAEWQTYDRAELDLWFNRLTERVHLGRETYSPGKHCRYCPRAGDCPARQSLMRQSVELLHGVADVALPTDPAAVGRVLGDVLDRVKLVEAACDQARALVKTQVQLAGGSLPIGDGRALVVSQQPQERIDDVAAGWEALGAALGDDLLPCLRASKNEVVERVRSRAPAGKGEKKRAEEDLLARLRQAGALRTTVVEKLEIKRVAQEIEEQP